MVTGQRLRILAVHRYFWPDSPPYASLLRDLVSEWARSGHDVEVLSSQPSYKPEVPLARSPWSERVDGVRVRRVPLLPEGRRQRLLKVVNMGLFSAQVAGRVLASRRFDVVMCSTSPPIILAAAVSIACRLRRVPFVYHCMDLHPETGRLSGDFPDGALFRLLLRVDNATCRRAAGVVVLSEDMRRSLLERSEAAGKRVQVINNFELPGLAEDSEEPPLTPPPSGRLRVIFTGNLGRFQGLDVVVRAVARSPDLCELVLMGEGAAKPGLVDLARRLGASNVHFLPHASPAQAAMLMRTADYGVVSLTPDVIRYAFPSKTMSYLSQGLPVLATVEADSDLARMISEHRLGVTSPPEDCDALAVLIKTLSVERGSGVLDDSARRAAQALFGRTAIFERWNGVLASVVGNDHG